MLSASGNLFKCHEEVLYLQPLIPPKRFEMFSPITGGCSEGLGAFRFFFKKHTCVIHGLARYFFFCFRSERVDRCVGVEHEEYLEAVDLTSYVGTIPTWLASYFLV